MQNAEENFVTLFAGNETSDSWFEAAVAMAKPWSEKLKDVAEDVQRSLQNCVRSKKKPA